jgi:glutaredoxin
VWQDVDDLADLRDLMDRLRTRGRAVHTRRCLKRHSLQRKDDATMTDKKDIQVYALTTCSHCKAAKRLLDDCTVHYDVVNVDTLEGDERKAILDDVKKFNPKCTFPTIIIGDKVIVGFKEKEIKEALGL